MNECREYGIEKAKGCQTYTDPIHQDRAGEIRHNDASAAAGNLEHLDKLQQVAREKHDIRALANGKRQMTNGEPPLSLVTRPSRTTMQQGPMTNDEGSMATDAALRMQLVGANLNASATGVDELAGKSNYFIGRDPARWRTNVPTYAKVEYEDVYPGVDLVYYGNRRKLEYDFVVAPGANPGSIQFAVTSDRQVGSRQTAVGESQNPEHESQSAIDNRKSSIAAPLRIDEHGDPVVKTKVTRNKGLLCELCASL